MSITEIEIIKHLVKNQCAPLSKVQNKLETQAKNRLEKLNYLNNINRQFQTYLIHWQEYLKQLRVQIRELPEDSNFDSKVIGRFQKKDGRIKMLKDDSCQFGKFISEFIGDFGITRDQMDFPLHQFEFSRLEQKMDVSAGEIVTNLQEFIGSLI